MWDYEDFVDFFVRTSENQRLDGLMTHTQALQGKPSWDDDYSMIELRFA